MFKNVHNSLNSLEYQTQYSVHNSLLHLLSNFQDDYTTEHSLKLIINALFNAL